MKIKAVVITKNEERMINDCLNSIDWVDEIILVDTGNTDKTNVIAKKHKKVRIIKYNGQGSFSDWRNEGFRAAATSKKKSDDWVFFIDADERVTPKLKKELLDLLPSTKSNAYAIPRKNFIFGKEFKYSGQYPDYQKRIFRASAFERWTGEIHEEPKFKGNINHLKNPLLHFKNMTLAQMVEKTNNWSEIEAKLMFESHHPPMNVLRFLSAMAREFWLRMILQTAFLDGAEGIIYAIYQVFSKFVSYSKLYELQIKSKEK